MIFILGNYFEADARIHKYVILRVDIIFRLMHLRSILQIDFYIENQKHHSLHTLILQNFCNITINCVFVCVCLHLVA